MLNNSVIDLADDYTLMLSGENGAYISSAETPLEMRRRMAEFELEARNYPHHQRCFPIGTPTDILMYVGCECDPYEGIQIYNSLVDKYPDHECIRSQKGNLSYTQQIMAQKGLMDWTKSHKPIKKK